MKYKNIPIAAAKRVAKEYDKDQVIILTWDKTFNKSHVTTFGKTVEDCDQAAEGGNTLKARLGWDDELCHEEPSRVKKMRKQIKDLKHRLIRIIELAGKVNQKVHRGDLLVEVSEVAKGNE